MPEVPEYPSYPSEDEIYISQCLGRALLRARTRLFAERILDGLAQVGYYCPPHSILPRPDEPKRGTNDLL